VYRYFIGVGKNIEASGEWGAFLRDRLTIFDSRRQASPQMRFRTPVDYWNFLYWNLSSLPERKFQVSGVKYEDLLQDSEACLDRIASEWKFARKSRQFIYPDKKMKRGGDKPQSRRKGYTEEEQFDRSKYANEEYLSKFSREDIDHVNSCLDEQLMLRLGYDFVEA
jgi:hypothetical protein